MTHKERAAVSIKNESETVSLLSTMRTAMQQALEAFEYLPEMRGIDEAITALREALAEQAEQEPYKDMSKRFIQATNGIVRIDPVTGNVGIGTPSKQAEQEVISESYCS